MLRCVWSFPNKMDIPQNSDTTFYTGALSMHVDSDALLLETPSDFPTEGKAVITFRIPKTHKVDENHPNWKQYGLKSKVTSPQGAREYELQLAQPGKNTLFLPFQ